MGVEKKEALCSSSSDTYEELYSFSDDVACEDGCIAFSKKSHEYIADAITDALKYFVVI